MNCTKVKFANEKFALEYCEKLRRTSTRARVPLRAYLCPYCVAWHLTSREDLEVSDLKRLRDELAAVKAELVTARAEQVEAQRMQKELVKVLRGVINVGNEVLTAGVSIGKNKKAVQHGANLMRELLKDVLSKYMKEV